jgi:hypothetical protein
MTTATKSALLLAATLAVGVLLGLLGASSLERTRRRPPGPPAEGGGLVRHMLEVIQPRDSAQRAAIEPVLERAAARNRDVIRGVNERMRASIDSMRAELLPILDEDQRGRLDEAARRLPPIRAGGGGPPFGRRGGGPPGRGGPDDGPPPMRGGPPPP